MNKMQRQVTEFHKKFGYLVNKVPTLVDLDTQYFRCNLIQEEDLELEHGMKDDNIVEIADALGDLLYVVIGTGVSYGIDLEKVFDEIHRSNMSKDVSGDSVKKAIKGKNYSPPDIKKVLK